MRLHRIILKIQRMFPGPSNTPFLPSTKDLVEKYRDLFVRAPEFDHFGYQQSGILEQYEVDGFLPGDLPKEAVCCFHWERFSAMTSDCLQVYPEQTVFDVKKKLFGTSYSRLRRLNLGMFRTDGEIHFGDQLSYLRVPSEWRTREWAVSPRALLLGVLVRV